MVPARPFFRGRLRVSRDREQGFHRIGRPGWVRVQGLDLGLRIDTEDHGVGGRIDIQADDVADLGGELRIVGKLEGADPVRWNGRYGGACVAQCYTSYDANQLNQCVEICRVCAATPLPVTNNPICNGFSTALTGSWSTLQSREAARPQLDVRRNWQAPRSAFGRG
jgi:hypothetical protein